MPDHEGSAPCSWFFALEIGTMKFASKASRHLAIIFTSLLLFGPASSAWAGESRAAATSFMPAALPASFMQNVVGNRQRMVQFAFVGFGIGVLILVTATRKH